MITKILLKRKEKASASLADVEWKNLKQYLKKIVPENIREKMDGNISDYLTKHQALREAVLPADFRPIIKKISKLSRDLESIFLESFFPFDPENRENAYDEAVKRRISKYKKNGEKPLIREVGLVDEKSISERNEYLRRSLVSHVKKAYAGYLMEDVEFLYIYEWITNISFSFSVIERNLPSARGEHGDPYLLEFIANALLIYREAGGKGWTAEKTALPFMQKLMACVAERALTHLGPEHARPLSLLAEEHEANQIQLVQLIKKARRRKSLWE